MDTTDAPQIIEHIHKGIDFTPYDTRWVPASNRFVAMGIRPNAKGALQVYQMNQGALELTTDGVTSGGIKCGTFGASSLEDRQIATGDHNGKLAVYDLERINQPIFEQQAHASIVNAIDGCGGLEIGYGAPEIVTGGRDGCVRLWDTRVPEPVLALEPGEGEKARDCWTVAFGNSYSDEDRCIVAGYGEYHFYFSFSLYCSSNSDIYLRPLNATVCLSTPPHQQQHVLTTTPITPNPKSP